VFDDVFLEAREVFHSRYREVLIVRVDAAKDVVFQTVLCDVRTRKRERESIITGQIQNEEEQKRFNERTGDISTETTFDRTSTQRRRRR